MIDIKQQVKEYLLKENISLTDVVNSININRPVNEKTTVQNINNKLTRGTIKYSEILEIAKSIGYNITWQKLDTSNLNTFHIEHLQPNNYPMQSGVNIPRIKENPINVLFEQEVHRFYSSILLLLSECNLPNIQGQLSLAKLNFDAVPLNSFIFQYSDFLYESLSYLPSGYEITPTILYLKSIYFQGGIAILQADDRQNLLNLFEYFYDKYFSDSIHKKD